METFTGALNAVLLITLPVVSERPPLIVNVPLKMLAPVKDAEPPLVKVTASALVVPKMLLPVPLPSEPVAPITTPLA